MTVCSSQTKIQITVISFNFLPQVNTMERMYNPYKQSLVIFSVYKELGESPALLETERFVESRKLS